MPDARSAAVGGRLELAQFSFTAGDELEYIVVNRGELPIMLEAAYGLERFEQHRWRVANPDAAFPAWGARLAPGQRARLTTCLPVSLPAGSYRLRKRLLADRDPILDTNGSPSGMSRHSRQSRSSP